MAPTDGFCNGSAGLWVGNARLGSSAAAWDDGPAVFVNNAQFAAPNNRRRR